jgi:Sigma factor regulator C-terminal
MMVKENNSTEQGEKKDFFNNGRFQKVVRRTKFKQILLYTLISFLTVFIILSIFYFGSHKLIDNKIERDISKITERIYGSPVKGAGIVDYSIDITYGFLNAEGKITYYKKMGDRKIPWKTFTKVYPTIGKVKEKKDKTVEVFYTSAMERTVRYNPLNNEREIDFYYPHIGYHVLPQELEIATGLDENTLIEVALSFKNPMTVEEVGKTIGSENVEWLWLDKSDAEYFNDLNYSDSDFFHVLHGEDAYGFSVSEDYPYWEIEYFNKQSANTENKISGVLVVGTPSELERFLKVSIIRSSVIGVTINKY